MAQVALVVLYKVVCFDPTSKVYSGKEMRSPEDPISMALCGQICEIYILQCPILKYIFGHDLPCYSYR